LLLLRPSISTLFPYTTLFRSFVSVLLLDEEEQVLKNLVSPSLSKTYNKCINDLLNSEHIGSTAKAKFLEKEQKVTSLGSEEFFQNFRQLAISNGLKAFWSIPIISSKKKVLGIFAIYRKESQE